MRICPNCKGSIDDDSVFCGYCDTKLPYIPQEETPEGEACGDASLEPVETVPAVWSCLNCGEQLEENFDTCWKCGAVRVKEGESPAEAGTEPLLAVWGLDKRVEVYLDKVLVAPSGAPGVSGQASYVAACEILIKDIVSIEFTSAKEAVAGCMAVNYTAAPTDDTVLPLGLSELVPFNAGAEAEMAKAMELIKRCRMDLDSRSGDF